MFEARDFRSARRCFLRGKDARNATLAEASTLVQEASMGDLCTPAASKRAFLEAGELFLELKSYRDAAKAFKKGKEPCRAGKAEKFYDSSIAVSPQVCSARVLQCPIEFFHTLYLALACVTHTT